MLIDSGANKKWHSADHKRTVSILALNNSGNYACRLGIFADCVQIGEKLRLSGKAMDKNMLTLISMLCSIEQNPIAYES